jgi:hypothetical protein
MLNRCPGERVIRRLKMSDPSALIPIGTRRLAQSIPIGQSIVSDGQRTYRAAKYYDASKRGLESLPSGRGTAGDDAQIDLNKFYVAARRGWAVGCSGAFCCLQSYHTRRSPDVVRAIASRDSASTLRWNMPCRDRPSTLPRPSRDGQGCRSASLPAPPSCL